MGPFGNGLKDLCELQGNSTLADKIKRGNFVNVATGVFVMRIQT